MNASFDIERELDRWLGPDEDRLPSRVIDAALARIDTTAQRRGPAVPRWRTPPMSTLMKYGGLVAALLAIVAGTALLFGGERPPDRPTPTDPAVSAEAAVPITSPTVAPTPTPTPPPTPVPTPIWTSPPLPGRHTSETYGYSVAIPDGYLVNAATEVWDPAVPTDMSSPWLERIHGNDYLMTFTARSVRLERPMTSEAWLDSILASPSAPNPPPMGTCTKDQWSRVPIGSETGFFYHEPCGQLYGVVAVGDRGYIFTMNFGVYDIPAWAAPFEATFKEMLASIELTPETATP